MIKIYSTPSCSACTALKNELDAMSFKYEAHMLTEDPVTAAAVMEKSAMRSVPIVHDTERDVYMTGKELLSEISTNG